MNNVRAVEDETMLFRVIGRKISQPNPSRKRAELTHTDLDDAKSDASNSTSIEVSSSELDQLHDRERKSLKIDPNGKEEHSNINVSVEISAGVT